jgi:hypothetical protein
MFRGLVLITDKGLGPFHGVGDGYMRIQSRWYVGSQLLRASINH